MTFPSACSSSTNRRYVTFLDGEILSLLTIWHVALYTFPYRNFHAPCEPRLYVFSTTIPPDTDRRKAQEVLVTYRVCCVDAENALSRGARLRESGLTAPCSTGNGVVKRNDKKKKSKEEGESEPQSARSLLFYAYHVGHFLKHKT